MIEKALAQNILPRINPGDLGGLSYGDLTEIVRDLLLPVVRPVLVALVILYIVWAGYQYITSAGDPAHAQKARANLTYAVLALVLVILVYALVAVLGSIIQEAGG